MNEHLRPIGGYGRVFESMYKGSMVGAGSIVFAVWPYVIANMRPDGEHGAVVELNPKLLAMVFGEKDEEEIKGAIEYLCAPDGESRSKEEGGRRLVQLGQFAYRVVNGAHYMALRKRVTDLAKHAEAQRRYVERKEGKKRVGKRGVVSATERLVERAQSAEEVARLEELQEGLPPGAMGGFGKEAQEVVQRKMREQAKAQVPVEEEGWEQAGEGKFPEV